MRKSVWIIKKVLLPSTSATSAMTLFSYAVSNLTGQQFREPALLNHFFNDTQQRPAARGWWLHYLVGLGFTVAYQPWKRFVQLPPTPDGLSYGALCGLIGILGWRITFATHPRPPRINRRGYLAHLVVAHLIFGLTLTHLNNFEDDR